MRHQPMWVWRWFDYTSICDCDYVDRYPSIMRRATNSRLLNSCSVVTMLRVVELSPPAICSSHDRRDRTLMNIITEQSQTPNCPHGANSGSRKRAGRNSSPGVFVFCAWLWVRIRKVYSLSVGCDIVSKRVIRRSVPYEKLDIAIINATSESKSKSKIDTDRYRCLR